MEKTERLGAANKLKSAFNLLWDEGVKMNAGYLGYRDIVRIGDAIRTEGPGIIGLKTLPNQIDSALRFAEAALDPNKARAKENIKKAFSLLWGASGIALAYVCLGTMINPGIWAIVIAFFAGGFAGGPFAIVGIAAGLLIAVGAVYAAFQKMTPQERSVKAHEYVMKGIDNWAEYGSDDEIVPVTKTTTREYIKKQGEIYGLSSEDTLAVCFLMMQLANADNNVVQSEMDVITKAVGGISPDKLDITMDETKALEHVKYLTEKQKKEIIAWCFQLTYADDYYNPKEEETLKKYCAYLDIDYDSMVGLHRGQ